MNVRKQLVLLESHLKKTFPYVKSGFYLSLRSSCVHMGLDVALFFFLTNCSEIIAEVNYVLYKNLDQIFIVNYPRLIPTVKWKFDYIICYKKQ